MSLLPGSLPPLDNTLGVTYVATIVAASLFGLTTVQTYIYYNRNPDDHKLLKALVFFLWVFDGLHIALICHAFYFITVTNFGNVLALLTIPRTLPIALATACISDSCVRGIFVYKIWQLSGHNKLLTFVIILASVLVAVSDLGVAARAIQEASYIIFQQQNAWLLYTNLSAVAATDVTIAAALCILLKRQETAFKRTKSIVRTLIVYTINTSALSSVCALIIVITYATMSTNLVWQAVYIVLPRLYLNSVLATLNTRQRLREMNNGELVSIPLSAITSGMVAHPTSTESTNGDSRLDIRDESSLEKNNNKIINIAAIDLKEYAQPHSMNIV